jgi:hypothetical protein
MQQPAALNEFNSSCKKKKSPPNVKEDTPSGAT